MSQLNKKTQAKKAISYNGNVQFAKKASQNLYELVTMSMVGRDSYYETNTQRFIRISEAVREVVKSGELDFIGNLIVHARTEMYMRSMPIVLAVLFARELRLQGLSYANMRNVICDVIQRADQITDAYAFALSVFGDKKKVPLAIKKGVADAFNKFDEYQFAKYNGKGEVKMSDVLRIVHPKTSDETQGEIFERIIKDDLKTPYTWETQLSQAGQEGKNKSVVWSELIDSGKVGYMAILRNIRNILDAGVSDEHLQKLILAIENEHAVARSKQFPFRFLNALESVSEHSNHKVNRAISRAIDASVGNLPEIGDNVWVITDCSGSMGGKPWQTASLFAAALAKAHGDAKNFKLTIFSDNAKHINFNPDSPVLEIVKDMKSEITGYGTNLDSALAKYKELGFEPDTIVLFSDMQVNRLHGGNNSVLNKPGVVKVAFNLNAYDSTPVSEINGWYQISGWSDKVFNFIPAMREGVSVVKTLSHPYEKMGTG